MSKPSNAATRRRLLGDDIVESIRRQVQQPPDLTQAQIALTVRILGPSIRAARDAPPVADAA